MKNSMIGWALATAAMILPVAMAGAQYMELWTISSLMGPAATNFDLGDESMALLWPTTHEGSSGSWPGAPGHSNQTLGEPGIGLHEPPGYLFPTNTVYGDTDGDGMLEFVSDNPMMGELVVWDGVTGAVEGSMPWPAGCTELIYILLLDVNAGNGMGTCEILIHWVGGAGGLMWGTTCYGLIGGTAAGEDGPVSPAVAGADLAQNVPNPFNPSTEISFSLEQAGQATLNIYDSAGRLVRTLLSDRQAAGDHRVTWDGRDDNGNRSASGMYYYELRTADRNLSRKALLLK